MEGKEKCMPEVPVSQWVCIRCLGVPSRLGKEGEQGWCRGKELYLLGRKMSTAWGRTPGKSSVPASDLLGKLPAEEWATWEQSTINSTIWVLLPIYNSFLGGEMISKWLGMFKFMALFAGYWIKGKFTT